MSCKGVDTYDETTLVSFWKQPLCGVTQKGNNDETMRKQRWNKHPVDHWKCWIAKMSLYLKAWCLWWLLCHKDYCRQLQKNCLIQLL